MSKDTNIFDKWLARVSSIITIFLFIIQLPYLNDLFVDLFDETKLPFKLLIATMLIIIASFFLNKISFEKDRVAIAIIATLFLVNVSNMLTESLFRDLPYYGGIFIALALIDGLGLLAAYLDTKKQNKPMYDFIKAIKIFAYIIFLFITVKFEIPI